MDIKNKFFILPNEVFELMLKPTELAVLCYLVKCSDKAGMCFPSNHTIAQACRMSDNTVRKAVRFLEKREIISKSGGYTTSKFGKAANTSYIYLLNPDFYNEGFSRDNLVEYYAAKDSVSSYPTTKSNTSNYEAGCFKN